MSEFILPLGLLATFLAVTLGAFVVGLNTAERRRALRVLESQVGEVPITMRQQQMSRSLSDRTLLPTLARLGSLLRRLTPVNARETWERKLVLVGQPSFWDADKIAAAKVLACGFGLFAGSTVTSSAAMTGLVKLVVMGFMTVVGFYAPNLILNNRGEARQEAIRRSLPDTMDLLTISVEAGLGFDAAILQVIRHVPGPLAEEFGRMLHEMRLGRARAESLRQLSQRTDVEELRSFVLAMVQADTFGVSISKVLRAQALELRTKRRQRAEESAMKVPIKILFPLIFCILPVLFIFILGPAVIRIAENLFGVV
jgi:tight adherence protein C